MKLIIDIPDYKLDEVQNGSIASNEILKAVRKGTPISTKGDLISRSELKKAIDTIKQTGYDTENEPLFDYVELPDLIKVIDNAPTVEPNWKFYYDHGYKQAERDLKRPQGEWEEGNHGDYERPDFYFQCSVCKEETDDTTPYCPFCGSRMKGDLL